MSSHRVRHRRGPAVAALHLKAAHSELEREQVIARIPALDLHLIRHLEPHRVGRARGVVIGARRRVALLRVELDVLAPPTALVIIIVVAVAALGGLALHAQLRLRDRLAAAHR
jgi:hypothetical protein